MTTHKSADNRVVEVVAGRTLDEQIGHIEALGCHGTPALLRKKILESTGIDQPKAAADTVLFFGCYLPFVIPSSIRDYIKVLERVKIDYTYLDDEFCCGFPMIETTTGPDQEKALQAGKRFMQANREKALQKGANKIAYICVWCAHLAKRFFPGDSIDHLYYPDLILDGLDKQVLKVTPMTVGYFEGCHRRSRICAPGIDLEWGKYRRLAGTIRGLEIVDLPNNSCCSTNPERIVAEAEKRGLRSILFPCVSCHVRVGTAGKGKIEPIFLPQLLLSAVGDD